MLLSWCPRWRNNFIFHSLLNSCYSDIPSELYNLIWNIVPQNLASRLSQKFISIESWALSRIRIRFTGLQPVIQASFPALCTTVSLIQSNSRSATGNAHLEFSLVWRQRGVYGMLVHDFFWREEWPSCFSRTLTDWWRSIVLAPPLLSSFIS